MHDVPPWARWPSSDGPPGWAPEVRDQAGVRNASRICQSGPAYDTETNYLRVYMQVRRRLEPEPSRPRHFLTEPGMGHRFLP